MNAQSFKETILQQLRQPIIDQDIKDQQLDKASNTRIAEIDAQLIVIDRQLADRLPHSGQEA